MFEFYLCQLVQVILQEGDLLFLCERAAIILIVFRVDGLLYSSLQILNKQFAQIVQGLQLFSHCVFQTFEIFPRLRSNINLFYTN